MRIPVQQRPLGGQYKLVINVGRSGNVDVHLIHLPHPESRYGAVLLSKYLMCVTEQELKDGDWCALLERAAGAIAEGL